MKVYTDIYCFYISLYRQVLQDNMVMAFYSHMETSPLQKEKQNIFLEKSCFNFFFQHCVYVVLGLRIRWFI